MIDVTAQRTIPAGAEAIWPLLDEPARLHEWFAFADGGEVIAGEGVGRRQRSTATGAASARRSIR